MPSRRRLLSISAKIALREDRAVRAGPHPAVDLGGYHDLVAAGESLIARPRISSLLPSE